MPWWRYLRYFLVPGCKLGPTFQPISVFVVNSLDKHRPSLGVQVWSFSITLGSTSKCRCLHRKRIICLSLRIISLAAFMTLIDVSPRYKYYLLGGHACTYDFCNIFVFLDPLPLVTVTLAQHISTLVCFWGIPAPLNADIRHHMYRDRLKSWYVAWWNLLLLAKQGQEQISPNHLPIL